MSDETETDNDLTLPCDRCWDCGDRAEAVLQLAEEHKLIDGEGNDRSTQILDLIVHLRHRYDQLQGDARGYASWEDLLDAVDTHYQAEVAGEDCDQTCKRHGHLFADTGAGEVVAMSWYVVTCRLSGDDEDSCLVLRADSWQEASSKAEASLRALEDDPGALLADDDVGDLEDAERETIDAAVEAGEAREFYLNYAVRCGDEVEPKIEMSAP